MSEELTPMDRMELWMSALNEAITNGTDNSFMPYNRYELWMKKLCEAILAKDPADPDVVQAFVEGWLADHPEATTTVEDGAVTEAKLAANAVTTAKVADGAVTDAKLAASGVKSDVADLKSVIDDIATVGKQLFDKDNADTKKYIVSGGVVSNSANGTSVIIPITVSPNDHYVTVHRSIITSRFVVSSYTSYPELGDSYVDNVDGGSAASLTIAVDTSIKYLMVYCHLATQDTTVTVAQVLAGLMVQYGQSYTGYEEYAMTIAIPNGFITPDKFASDVPAYIKSQSADANVTEFVDNNMKNKRTSTSTALTWTEGSYYSLTTGEITTLSGRAYSQKIACKAGDVVEVKNNKGQLLFWDNNGSFLSYVATDYPQYALIVAPTNAGYFAFNNSDSTIRATDAIKHSSASELIETVYEGPAKLIYDSSDFTNAKYASTSNGKISDFTSAWYCGIALPCEAAHKYRTESQTQVVFYDASMTFISAILPNNSASYTGVTTEMDFSTPANCAYMSINTYNSHEKVFDLAPYKVVGEIINPQKLEGLNVVCFGDSITGNYGFGDNIPYQIEKLTGAKTFNCGFGGCRMELIENDAQHTNPFSMCGIVDALEADKNGDADAWDEQDAYAESISKMVFLRLQILKSIDFSTVDVVTIAYGTNEGGYPQDDEQDHENKYTYGGATRYAVNKLLSLYPKLRIILLTPIYRYYTSEGKDSDTHTHPTYGGKLTDNVETLISVGKELKIPVVDLYYTLGINITNYTSYFGDDDETPDGTHINSFGREQFGRRVAGELIKLM